MTRIAHKRRARRAALACTALAAVILATAPAGAGTEVSVSPNGFGGSGFEVISEDGKTWTKIQDKGIHLSVRIGIGRTDEEVVGYVLRQPGQPGTYQDSWLLRSNFDARARVDADLVALGQTTNFTAAERQQALDLCNSRLHIGAGIHQTHDLFYIVPMQLVGFFTSLLPAGQANVGGTPGHIGNGSAMVPVTCKGAPRGPGDLAEQPKELKAGSIDLSLSASANATSKPNHGTVCKKARVAVRLTANKIGLVNFKLWIKAGDAPMSDKVVNVWSSHVGPGRYEAEYDEWVEVTKTGVVQAMAEDLTNPIGQSTGWKDVTLHCADTGVDGFADVPDTNNPDNDTAPRPLKVTGELTLADGGPKDRPRPGQAVFKIWANKPGDTKWKLTCSGGRNWEGTLPTFKIGDHKYQAVGATNFQISKTEQIGCALRSMSLPNKNVIAVASELFELIKRNPKVDPVVGETNPSDPTHTPTQTPRVPGFKVAPLPKLVCIGGKAAGVTCACPPRTDRIQFGPHSYRCQVNVVAPRPTFEGPREDFRRPGFGGPRPGFNRPFARPLGPPMHGAAIGPRRFFR
jgi:hypothetical protein